MAESFTTPHSLPILGTGDFVRSPSGDNLRKQLNALATATNNAITAEGAKYVPAWKSGTVYTAGQRVISPSGDIVAAKADHTSGTTYTAANWTASAQDGRIGAIESKQAVKSVRSESGKWVWDVSSAATHYVIPDHTGALVVRATPWPVPAATPALDW